MIPSEILSNFSPLGLSLRTPQSLRSINFCCPLCDSLHIISQTFSFVKRFFKSFLRFFRSFSRLIGCSYVIRFRLLKPVRLFRDSVYVRCFLRQLAYYSTRLPVCQALFSIFFAFCHFICLILQKESFFVVFSQPRSPCPFKAMPLNRI